MVVSASPGAFHVFKDASATRQLHKTRGSSGISFPSHCTNLTQWHLVRIVGSVVNSVKSRQGVGSQCQRLARVRSRWKMRRKALLAGRWDLRRSVLASNLRGKGACGKDWREGTQECIVSGIRRTATCFMVLSRFGYVVELAGVPVAIWLATREKKRGRVDASEAVHGQESLRGGACLAAGLVRVSRSALIPS